jgi:NAD(P)-dependent dehydrogenase (short-subunit alcohol dehydrogenase family)
VQIFRQNLLDGRSIALAGPLPEQVATLLATLGAQIHEDRPVDMLVCAAKPPDVLVCAAKPPQDLADEPLLEQEWAAIQALATEVFIPAKAGRIILIAPREDTGVLKAALENLARTLSVEWARHGITTTAIAPGSDSSDDELANVVAYLCSEAGAYFSGCRLDMR